MNEGKAEGIKETTSKKFDFSGVAYKMKNNPWMISTAVLLLIVLVLAFRGGITGGTVSENKAEYNLVTFANSVGIEDIKINSITKEGALYLVDADINGEQAKLYITPDGKYLINGITPLTSSSVSEGSDNTPKAVPKSDKPVVEAFIFSYCPYGLQFEKALAPVYDLMKNKADIRIVAIGAMHGEYEHQETLRQIAIQEIYGNDKLWAYLKKFDADTAIGDCRGDEKCITPLVEKIFTSLGIDKAKVNDFMVKSSEAIYKEQNARAAELGISGSPTFVINGVTVNAERNPASILTAICSAFNTSPEECSQKLSSESASAGFGGGSSTTSSGAQC